MWKCETCGEESENNFEVCWNCQTPKSERSVNISEPTVRTVKVEQSKQTTKLGGKDPQTLIRTGLIGILGGGACLMISPLIKDRFGLNTNPVNTFFTVAGVINLIVGGICFAVGLSRSFAQQSKLSKPTPQPNVTQAVSPKRVTLGNTLDEVQLVMGNPNKIINLDARVIHIYDDMKIIYDDGKVSDVQL
jgi:hypothetical protein